MGNSPYAKKILIKKDTDINEGKSYKEYLEKAKEKNPYLYKSYKFGTFKNKDKLIIKGE
ncbi:MAG: hypothetical protein GY870_06890 [archaeon]|nr:hypothetical protein [archaeon]